jgi:hypothetical protein
MGQINGIDISDHGKLCALATDGQPGLKVYRGDLCLSPKELDSGGYRVAFLNDATMVASLGPRGLDVFRISPWQLVWSCRDFQRPYRLAVDGNSGTRFIAVGDDNGIRVFSTAGNVLASLPVSTNTAEGLTFIETKWLATTCTPCNIRVYGVDDWQFVNEFSVEENYLRSLRGRSSSNIGVGGGYGGALVVFESSGVRHRLATGNRIESVALDRHGQRVFVLEGGSVVSYTSQLERLASYRFEALAAVTLVEKGGVLACAGGYMVQGGYHGGYQYFDHALAKCSRR